MKQDMNYSRYVDRYLENVMSNEERIWFEKELEGNTELKNEVDFQMKLHSVISDRETLELQEQLDSIYNANYKPWTKVVKVPASKRSKMFWASGIAASVAVSLLLFISISTRNLSKEDLIGEYYEPAEISMSYRAKGEESNMNIRKAMNYYENHQYAEAIALFEVILSEDESRIGLNLYSGISNMEIQEYEKANKNFEKIIDDQTNAFIESANWYLGLCYVMTEENEKARSVFTQIVSEKGHYAKDAKKLLRRL